MKINLLVLILSFLFVSCNSQLADLSPINRTPIHLETTNADSFTTMMIWATNGSHSFARSYTSAPVLDEELPKGNYEFYAATFDGAPFLLKCARVNQRLQGKMNFITLDFHESNCSDSAFLGPDPDLNMATLPAVSPAGTKIEFCEDLNSITQGDDQCTDNLAQPLRKSGRGHASSFRVSMMTFENNVQDPNAGVGFSYCSGGVLSSASLRGDDVREIANSLLPGNGSAPFFIRLLFYQSSTDCTGDPVVLDLPRGLSTGLGKSKLIVSPGSPAVKKIFVKLAGPEICQGGRLAQEFAGGSGSLASPHLICNATQLRNIFPNSTSGSDYRIYASRNYKLLSNIDLSGEPVTGSGYTPLWSSCVLSGSNFMPIGTTWDGTTCGDAPITTNFYFDGGGYEIKGLRIRRGGADTGFYKVVFPTTGASTIQRLKLRDSYIEGGLNSGSLVGAATMMSLNQITLTNPTVLSTSQNTGGVVGQASGVRFEDIKVEAINLTGTNNAGGIAGSTFFSGSTLTRHHTNRVNGQIRGQQFVGGIAGRIDSLGLLTLIKESRFRGDIEGKSFLGGLVGLGISLKIEDSYARVKITTNPGTGVSSNTGGLVGGVQSFVTNAGIFSSYAIPVVVSSCDLSPISCNIGAIAGSLSTYSAANLNTSVYPVSFPFTSTGGIPQPDASFQSYAPGWMDGSTNLMPFFDPSIWEFQNGAYPRLLSE